MSYPDAFRFGLPHYPKFYYSGNRFHSGDLDWIQKQLGRLGKANRKIASDIYEQIFVKGGKRNRHEANEFLKEFCDEFGFTHQEYSNTLAQSGGNPESHKFAARIEALKELKPKADIVAMAERNRRRKPQREPIGAPTKTGTRRRRFVA
ncbi:TPA: hypothetical protein P0E12_004977 [Vibrio harveyi]|nr:hypothetical protein [Vibrio harveyi]